ncbi:MAG: phosphoglucomutase/phosphomannomutase family protein [Dehalococcoidales bacterium]|nr:phosphoglucomutase/phosphomannomutase family protein [Dehalococcoidales bacterium]
MAQDFTFDNVRVCAQAVADYLKETGLARQGIIIGFDTRFASEDFAAAAAEVVAGNRVKVQLCPKATPTPVVSFGITSQKAGGGIIITASHNPARWNGFKFKDDSGSSAAPQVTARIEENIARILTTGKINKMPLSQAREAGLLEHLDLEPIYCRQLSSLINLDEICRSRLKIAIDPMYGAGAGYFKKFLSGGNTELIEINSIRNPLFPGIEQPEPIGTNLEKLAATVRKERASIGLATDGDADRIGIIDENGTFISTLHVFALLCLYLLEVRGERGPIVKTLTMSSMAYRLGEIFDVPVYETPVGFKYVAPIMKNEQALIGGEESGGYGFRGHVTERDGILAGLYFLDLMIKTGKSPSELIDYLHSKVGPHYYRRIDVEFSESKRQVINKRVRDYNPESIDDIRVDSLDTRDGFRFMLADTSWLLIRFSNTEPLLRLYAESNSPERVERLLGMAQELVKS